MRRNLDGCYFRIDSEDICFSDLTQEQMNDVIKDWDKEQLKRMCIMLGQTIRDIGDSLDLVMED